MTNPTFERAGKALRDEVERQVQAQGSYSGPENERPDYVDAELDYPALCRAVLIAVRDNPDLPGVISVDSGKITANECMAEMIDAILNDGEGK